MILVMTRLRRSEQVERNRELVLAGARRVFLDKGYAGASLEAIAEEAGFSKGVVYSQFTSKADLFLVLLERRIAERAEENERVAAELAGIDEVTMLVGTATAAVAAEPEWSLLVVEFRAHAARDPELNARYAAVHARAVDGVAATLGRLHRASGLEPAFPLRTMAELVMAFGAGIVLERVADPTSLPAHEVTLMLANALGAAPTPATRPARG
ncbi:MAG: TetR family transcriptional regulator [Acidimicrobiia bacterium]|nr:TetR family transcriptional regulator [Acidimicrobiia bacterium]